jgi:hypothetical protein
MHSNGLPWYRRVIRQGPGIVACLLVTASTASAHGGMAGPDELGPPLFTSAALAFVCYWAVILWPSSRRKNSNDAPDGRRRPAGEDQRRVTRSRNTATPSQNPKLRKVEGNRAAAEER